MRLDIAHFDERNESIYGFLNDTWRRGADNSAARRQMMRILSNAVRLGLTDLQKRCLTEYNQGKKQKVIAEELGIAPSTVCRHIKAAEKRLRYIGQYYTK